MVESLRRSLATRDADLDIDDDAVTNLRQALRSGLNQRHFGDAIRLEVVSTCPDDLADFLLLQSLASSTGGEYFRALRAEDLDASGDAKDQAKTEANLKKLDGLLKVLGTLADVASAEGEPRLEGRNMSVIVVPTKTPPKGEKKAPGTMAMP